MRKLIVNCIVLFSINLFTALVIAEEPYEVAWSRQLGAGGEDYSYSVAVDGSGNAFISGYTDGSLGGIKVGPYYDAFLAKYNSAGSLLWTKQLGTSADDGSNSVAVDSSGNAYISGYTGGNLGGTNAGKKDAFLTKYDSAGSLLWTKQLGTSADDGSQSVAVDGSGNAYISGYTGGNLVGTSAGSNDAFLTKYDSAGSLLWTKQLGTGGDEFSRSVAVDGLGNAFISGLTNGDLGGTCAGSSDAFLTKYDSAGSLLWTKQLGTSTGDVSYSVAVDGFGNAFISGYTRGNLVGMGTTDSQSDAFLTKYDPSGNLLWTEQFGTLTSNGSTSVAVDSSGNAFISGSISVAHNGYTADDGDVLLIKYDPAGNLLWTEQLGSARSKNEVSMSVAIDGSGNAFISGYTRGDLGGINAGWNDAFLIKLTAPVPEPATLALFGVGCVLLRQGRKPIKLKNV